MKCRCGWMLPESVLAYDNKAVKVGEETATNNVRGVRVSLICPKCKSGHAFWCLSDAEAVADFARNL